MESSIKGQMICLNEFIPRKISINKYGKNINISREIFYKLYSKNKLSITQIANKLKLGRTTIRRYLNRYNIKIRSSKDGQRLRLAKDGKFGGYLQKRLNKRQKQLILGTLLGDGTLCLGKRNTNAKLRIRHSGKDMEYLKFKRDILDDFVTGKISKDSHQNKKMNKTYYSYYFATKTHPEFTRLHKQFYKNGKKILTKRVLQQIVPFGLAIWIMDDGHYNKKGKFMDIYSMGFIDKENQIIIEWFNKKFGIKPKINYHKQCKKLYLRFNQENTRKLIQIIKPHVIKSMSRKIV